MDGWDALSKNRREGNKSLRYVSLSYVLNKFVFGALYFLSSLRFNIILVFCDCSGGNSLHVQNPFKGDQYLLFDHHPFRS